MFQYTFQGCPPDESLVLLARGYYLRWCKLARLPSRSLLCTLKSRTLEPTTDATEAFEARVHLSAVTYWPSIEIAARGRHAEAALRRALRAANSLLSTRVAEDVTRQVAIVRSLDPSTLGRQRSYGRP